MSTIDLVPQLEPNKVLQFHHRRGWSESENGGGSAGNVCD